MFKKLFGLMTILFLAFLPLLTLAETALDEEMLSEEDEIYDISIGGPDLSAGANCFDYYHFNSVEIDFGLKQSVLASGETMNVEVILRNHNTYPIVDGGLLVQVFREKQGGRVDAGNYLVDEFWAARSLTVNALGEKSLGFDWKAPDGLSGGNYFFGGHFIVAEKMNLSGLSFAEGIYGGVSYFSFEESEVSEVYFDKESAKVNGQTFLARSFIPQIETDEATVSFSLKNLSAQSQEFNLAESLYRWDNVGPEQMIWSEERPLIVAAGATRSLEQKFSDLEAGVYLFEARTDHSILKVRFAVNQSGAPSRINFLALTEFPIRGNQPNSFFICFHGVNDFDSNEARVEVVLEDEMGNEISRWDYEGVVTSSIMADVNDFMVRRDYNQVWLRGRIYQDGSLVDQIDLFYDVNDFTDPVELAIAVEDGQLKIRPVDMAGRTTPARMAVEVRDEAGNLIYHNPSYYGNDLRESINFVAGQNYQIRVLSGGMRYDAEYLHRTGSSVWIWLIIVAALLLLVFILFRRKDIAKLSEKTTAFALVGLLLVGLIVPLIGQASQQSWFDQIRQQLGGRASLSQYQRQPSFSVSPLKTGRINIDTRSASRYRLSDLTARTTTCDNRRYKDHRNPCERIYESCKNAAGSRIFARHLSLRSEINFTANYPIYLENVETGARVNPGDIITMGDVVRVVLDEADVVGEWYFTGGNWDTPPIAWLNDAQAAYEQTEPIDESYLTQFQVDARQIRSQCRNILEPKTGVAATNPLTAGQVQVVVSDGLRVYQEGGHYYIEAMSPGIGEVQVNIPQTFAYATIDNLWFQNGSIPSGTQLTAFGVVPEDETLSVSLSADPASGNAPLTIDLTATVNPESTATGPTNYTFWCDCSYTGTKIEDALIACGPPQKQVVGIEADSYTAVGVCTYEEEGNYTPKVIVERGMAEAAQAQVSDLQVLDVPGTAPTAGNLTMDPASCGNNCLDCSNPLQPILYWKFNSEDNATQSGFEVHFATNQAFNNYINVTQGWIESASEAFTVAEGFLSYGREYYWRVRVRDDRGLTSAWSVYGSTYRTPPHPYPEPDFSWTPEPPVLEEETQFKDESKVYSGGVSTWQWSFPEAKRPGGLVQNPLAMTDRDPVVIFMGGTGARSVKMTITDGDGLYCAITKTVPTTGAFGLPDYEETPPL